MIAILYFYLFIYDSYCIMCRILKISDLGAPQYYKKGHKRHQHCVIFLQTSDAIRIIPKNAYSHRNSTNSMGSVDLCIQEEWMERISSALGWKLGWGMYIGSLSLQGKLRWRIVWAQAVSVGIDLTHCIIHWGRYTLTTLSSIMDYTMQKPTLLPLSCPCVHMSSVISTCLYKCVYIFSTCIMCMFTWEYISIIF